MKLLYKIALLSVAIVVTSAFTSPINAQGTDQFWTNATGGEFHFPFNWNSSVPFENDNAYFEIEANYTVELTADALVNGLTHSEGNVTFVGGNTLTTNSDLVTSSATGSLSIAGAGTEFDINGDLLVEGFGSLNINADTFLRSNEAFVASTPVISQVVVGTDAQWVTDQLFIGTNGMTLGGAGIVIVEPDGRLNVGDEDMVFNGVTVGSPSGSAVLDIRSASVFGTNDIQIGRDQNSEGAVFISNTASLFTADLTVGNFGDGVLTIESAASASGDVLNLGFFFPGTGDATISGKGSTATFDQAFIGRGGTGSMVVDASGLLDVATLQIGTGSPNGNGTLTVDGIGSLVNTSGNVSIGINGSGSVLVANGATLDIANELIMASNAGSQGTLDIETTGQVIISDEAIIGSLGVAQVNVRNNGVLVANNNLELGELSTLRIEDSIFESQSTLTVNGMMLLRDSAEIKSTQEGPSGIILAGNGQIRTENAGTAIFSTDVSNSGLQIRTQPNSTVVFTNDYSGIGAFTGTGLVAFEGNLEFGPAVGDQTATTSFGGTVMFEPSTAILFQIGGVQAGQFDRLEIAGNLNIGGASLSGTFVDSYSLSIGQQFVIMTVGGNVSGEFDGLPEGATVASPGGIDLTITYMAGDGNDIALISEEFIAGDVNCDGSVDLLDVAPFVNVLSGGGFISKADINGDGIVSLLDVQPFVSILAGN